MLTMQQTLSEYTRYYNTARTHLALNKDVPVGRETTAVGVIQACPVRGRLHHFDSRAG